MKTVSLGLAKQLKEMGYPQVTEFYHVQFSDDPRTGRSTLCRYSTMPLEYQHPDKEHDHRRFASPTADEILDQLPKELLIGETHYFLQIAEGIDKAWQLDYRDTNDGQVNAFVEDTIADAAAKMWLYLKKEGLL